MTRLRLMFLRRRRTVNNFLTKIIATPQDYKKRTAVSQKKQRKTQRPFHILEEDFLFEYLQI